MSPSGTLYPHQIVIFTSFDTLNSSGSDLNQVGQCKSRPCAAMMAWTRAQAWQEQGCSVASLHCVRKQGTSRGFHDTGAKAGARADQHGAAG